MSDHARETREDMHAAEEAVAAAVERVSKAEVDALSHLVSWARTRKQTGFRDQAEARLAAAAEAFIEADRAHDAARADRDRIGGRA